MKIKFRARAKKPQTNPHIPQTKRNHKKTHDLPMNYEGE